ncbi:hypothetical protein [Streptomyces sp. Midd1]|uniref:hypothetical protein n=1 Tax=Streptomyces sp. Midd3 TaxID=3161191 RepID=UPI0034DB580C
MCRANPDCDEDLIEVNTTIWFDGSTDASRVILAGLDDVGFQLVCPTCNNEIEDENLHKAAKARIDEFAKANDAQLADSPDVIYESDRMRAAFDEIAKHIEDEATREKWASIVAGLRTGQPSNTDDKDSSA